MQRMIIVALSLALASPMAFAQSEPSADPQTPAVATPDSGNPTAPVAGENSFTEAQARERIEAAGFAAVEQLTLDDKGIWRATAVKDTKTVTVAMDYQGNVVAQ